MTDKWEYAAGHQGLSGDWVNDLEPTTFELASRDLFRMTLTYGEQDWTHDLRIIKRSDRHPPWQPVNDHAAEVVADTLEEIAGQFGVHGSNIIQGADLHRILNRVARALVPREIQEYDE